MGLTLIELEMVRLCTEGRTVVSCVEIFRRGAPTDQVVNTLSEAMRRRLAKGSLVGLRVGEVHKVAVDSQHEIHQLNAYVCMEAATKHVEAL